MNSKRPSTHSDETATYLDELAAEAGEPTDRQRVHADSVARRIRERGRGVSV